MGIKYTHQTNELKYFITVETKKPRESYFLKWDGEKHEYYLSCEDYSYTESKAFAEIIKEELLKQKNIESARVVKENNILFERTQKEIEEEMRIIESEREVKAEFMRLTGLRVM